LYESTHDSILPPVQFKISDKEYQSFTEYVKSLKTEYKSETQKAIENLIEVAKKEKYYDKTAREIDALKTSVKQHEITDDMLMYKKEIKQLLEDEIVKRYYYRKGVIKKNLAESESIKNATELLKNNTIYNSLLKPK
jgi:carboxyl-terminal processing protease